MATRRKRVAYAAEDERPNKTEIEKGNDLFEVGNDNLFVTEAAMPVHVWLVPAEGGDAKRLTSGTWSLPAALPPSPPSSPLSWSPDGKLLAFVRVETPHSGDSDQSTVRILDVGTGAIRAVTGKTHFEGTPVFSPDGTRLSYWCPRDRDPNNVNDIHVTPAASGGEGTNLTKPIDRCLYASVWTPDGKALLVGGNDGTRVSLWLAPLEGPAKRLELGDVNPAWSFFVDATVGKNGSIVFVGSEPGRPPELFVMVSPAAAPRRLTDLNAEIAGRDLGKVETFTWQGPDGWKEDGVVVLPPGLPPGAKVPLVLYIHGGPQAASTRAFSAPAQLLAAQGWAVFMPNYRGSDNLGNAYQRAIFNDAGDGPGRDVLAGVDALLERGFVDPSRIAVSGWSYGGYMTSWLIGHDTRWKAAVAGAAVTDLSDQYFFADFNVQMRYAMKGFASPFSPGGEALYRTQSPDHLRDAGEDADADPLRHRRLPRPAHAVVQALPRAEAGRRRDVVRGDPGRGPLPRRPDPVTRALAPLDRLAGAEAEMKRGRRTAAPRFLLSGAGSYFRPFFAFFAGLAFFEGFGAGFA